MGAEEEGSTNIKEIEIEEEVEGERVDSDDYFFERIGNPIPILQDCNPLFDLQTQLPASPLAVSQPYRLIFLAYSSGFYVAKTMDVMDAADAIKAKGTCASVQELCVADVPIGKVHILSLSTDSSTLSVSVDAYVHFFLVDSLLKKEPSPFFSCSLNETNSFVKDFKWRRSSETSYLLLSNHGNLYHAAIASPLRQIMDSVDAVEWSLKGSYVSVARANVLHILSSKFKGHLRISLSFKSWTADSDSCSIKVDSIRWVRSDSIVLGCFQQTADGKEENYLMQVIKSKDGKITDACSKVSVLLYYDLFSGLIDDILPFGNVPYLLLSYLEQCRLAIIANRKNTDQHILLLRWFEEDDNSETAIFDIDRDTWIPRIELQGNGDDNLIMGLCVDSATVTKRVKVEVGLEQRELSPFCVLYCVTLEGKLVMFYVASAAGPDTPPETGTAIDDEEEHSFPHLPAGYVQSNIPCGPEKETLGPQLDDASIKEMNVVKGSGLPINKDLMPGNTRSSTITEQRSGKDTTAGGWGAEYILNFKPSVSDGQEKTSATKMYQNIVGQQMQHFGQQIANLGQSSFNNSPPLEPNYFSKQSETENEKSDELKSAPASFDRLPTLPIQINAKDVQKSGDLPQDSIVPSAFGSTGLQGASPQSRSSERVMFSGRSESKPSTLTSNLVQGHKSENIVISADARNVRPDFAENPFTLKDNISTSPSVNLSVGPTQIMRQKSSTKTGTIDSLSSIRGSQLSSQESLTLGRPSSHWPYSSKDAHRISSLPNSEPYLSRQFGNIKEMAKELDLLLERIEEPGGFRDACTVSQRSSVETLEDHMQTLFGECRMWKTMIDEQHRAVQHLLDKTVQVLARQLYMDGIIKQVSDSHYWEFWNRQKLSSELELKRRHLLKLNQVLTNQLIELERHFNILELCKFDENDGAHKGRRAFKSRYGHPREIQPLHSLHNTANSQLAAAERLSECLSEQMAVLSIESPAGKKNVKKELFEAVGIPYDPILSSPESTKVVDSSSPKKLLHSGSLSYNSQSRRCQSSVVKTSDIERARRRRDSLDQSWGSFEPKKTTVKRVLLQESQKTGVNKLFLMDRQQLEPSTLGTPSVSHTKDLASPSALISHSRNEGVQCMFSKHAFDAKSTTSNRANESFPLSQSTSQATGFRSPMLGNGDAAQRSISPKQTSHMRRHVFFGETSNVSADKLSCGVAFEKYDSALIRENKPTQQFETSLNKNAAVSMELPAQMTTPKMSNEMLNYMASGDALMNSRVETISHGVTNRKEPFLESHGTNNETSFSLVSSAAPDVSFLPGKVPQFSAAASRNQPLESASFPESFSKPLPLSSSPVINSSLSISSSVSSTSSSVPSLSATNSKTDVDSDQTVFSVPDPSYSVASLSAMRSKTAVDANQSVSSMPISLVSSPVFTSSSFSHHAPKSLSHLRTPPAVSEPCKTEVQSVSGLAAPSLNPIVPSMPESSKAEAQLSAGNTQVATSHIPSLSILGFPQPSSQSPNGKTLPSAHPTSSLTTEPSKPQQLSSTDKFNSSTDGDTATTAMKAQLEPSAFNLKLESPITSAHTTEGSAGLGSGSDSSLNSMSSPASGIQLFVQPKQTTDARFPLGAPLASDSAASGKNGNSDVAIAEEDEMEEEAPEASRTNGISLGSIGNFGLGSTPTSAAPKAIPFGVSFSNIGTSQAGSPFTMSVPSGELFRPASFSFQSLQPSQSSPPTNMGVFSGGFGAKAVAQAPAPSAFGQPAQIGAGQQALGSVLGSFGQSRQFGAGLSGGFASASTTGSFANTNLTGGASSSGFAAVASTGGGFAGLTSGSGGFGGFSGVASGGGGFGGFAGVASGGGGFGGLASGGGAFAAASASSGGFAGASGGGFAGAGGGFGAFNSQQGAGGFSAFSGNAAGNQQLSGGFSAFGGNAGGSGKPPELFTQMRK